MNSTGLASISDRWKSRWGITRIVAISLVIGVVLVSYSLPVFFPSRACQVPAIYNFGDSNSDTGSSSATFGRLPSPYGETFFGKPSGRCSDGRLVIDFIAEELGLPYLSAYLDSMDSDFKHGSNFAVSGSTIQPADGKLFGAGFNPLSLSIQLSQFQQFRDRTIELYKQDRKLWRESRLPGPEDFSKALYTLDCGQNDLHFGLISMIDEEKVVASIPSLINQFAIAIEKLYQEGARTFWIHNTGPIGCLPFPVIKHPPKPGNADQIGCVKSYNDVAQEFNKQLKEKVSKVRTQLLDAVLILVDIYSAKYSLISKANKYGFDNPLGYCCGHHEDHIVECGKTIELANGTNVYGGSCSDPSKYISWDGIHYTEAANQWVANRIIDGSLSDPPTPVVKACS
ncbi:hypothetical protein P3X46_011635 [Hevea brasiliensis]|uniref:Uncharacterized protein n=1 Tax=Hevea brasiliensis TaxID=3981 RepID=A0ABQ9MBE2_HEVBR|nr:GDSL esterase/lipase At5g14450 [Hevea brasiliensis]XP_058006482.1 GDSL esterase/lipase At5g14450 [Hevea brasiliensis]KAJ9176305.1 hypothetical protein P3X46_011635 [Hevea brasiliensis]